jgi:hypothetical protein
MRPHAAGLQFAMDEGPIKKIYNNSRALNISRLWHEIKGLI